MTSLIVGSEREKHWRRSRFCLHHANNWVSQSYLVICRPCHAPQERYTHFVIKLTKDVFKAILSHSGMLIRDKISFHRKAKPQNQMIRQLSSYTHLGDLRADDGSPSDISSSEPPSRQSTESLPILHHTPSMPRTGSGFLSPLASVYSRHEGDEDKSSGLFNNALTRHLRDISRSARHRDGIGDESEESSVRKAKMLLGKFVGK